MPIKLPRHRMTDSDLTELIVSEFGSVTTENENIVIDQMLSEGWKRGDGPQGNIYCPPSDAQITPKFEIVHKQIDPTDSHSPTLAWFYSRANVKRSRLP